MEKNVFRQKSIDRITSPEKLDDYIKISQPGIWLILAAAVLLIAGAFVWGIAGKLETVLTAAAEVKDGAVVAYVREECVDSVKPGSVIRLDDVEIEVTGVDPEPMISEKTVDSYVMHLGGIEPGEWIYKVYAVTDVADGMYSIEIVTESINPISLIFN